MKKIVHLAPLHERFDVRVFHKECRSLVSAGYAVSLVVADNLGNEVVQGVEILDVGLREGARDRYIGSQLRALRLAIRAKPDVIHFHDSYLLPFAILASFGPRRFVYDVHEDMPRQSLAWRFSPLVNRMISFSFSAMEFVSRFFFAHFVCATPHIASRFPAKKTTTAQNYPIIDEFNFALPKDRSLVAYIGGVSKRRGLAVMSAAIKMLNEVDGQKVELAVAGPIANEADSALLRGNPHIHYLGNLDRQGVRDLLDRAAVGLCVLQEDPNFRNSKPVKMYEYLASGQSVVASDFEYWQELFEEFQAVRFVAKSDPSAVAGAIRQILQQSPETLETQARAARSIVAERFSWESQAVSLVHAYKAITA